MHSCTVLHYFSFLKWYFYCLSDSKLSEKDLVWVNEVPRSRSPTMVPFWFLSLTVVSKQDRFIFLQHIGVRGVHGDHVAEVVAVELNIDPDPVMELDRAPGHQASRAAVTMAHAVRWVSCLLYFYLPFLLTLVHLDVLSLRPQTNTKSASARESIIIHSQPPAEQAHYNKQW